jgi:hypothetical protein
MKNLLQIGMWLLECVQTIYLFGESDIPVAAIPSVCGYAANPSQLFAAEKADDYSPRAGRPIKLVVNSHGIYLEPTASTHLSGMLFKQCII